MTYQAPQMIKLSFKEAKEMFSHDFLVPTAATHRSPNIRDDTPLVKE